MLQTLSQTIISAVVGFAGGIGAVWAQQYFAWRPQRRIELRRTTFDEAVNALAMYQVDALDTALQGSPQPGTMRRLDVVLRVETRVQMQRARSLVRACFPEATFEAFRQAIDADVGIHNIPNTDFDDKATKAIKLMATDIGIL